MEYTRSVGDDYVTFDGTPKEIAELVKLIGDRPQPAGRKLSVNVEGVAKGVVEKVKKELMVSLKTDHKPVPAPDRVMHLGRLMSHKNTGYACSCGVEGCELYETERG